VNNKNSTSRLVTCALLSLGFGFAAASQAMELQPEAAPPGIGFRAVGYDPPWLFELERRGGIRFIAEGRITIVSPVRDFIVNAAHGGVIYGNRTESQELLAEIVQLSCLDTTSGEQLSHTVTIRLDGREYHGCGRRISNAESADYASFGDRAPAPAR
jgi:uncharacterized membrane protein